MICSLFCARIERKNLKISLIIRKEALCPQSKAYTDKEELNDALAAEGGEV